MFRARLQQCGWLVLALALPFLSGCGHKVTGGSLKGTVTFNGVPVPRGAVNFYLWDDVQHERIITAPAPGSAIDGRGKYHIDDIPPGKYLTYVTLTFSNKYKNPNEFVEVSNQRNQVVDFNLTSE